MRAAQFALNILLAIFFTSCASGYKTIQPENIKYVSRDIVNDVTLEYKYNLLKKKYEKKEEKKGVQVVAVKITNNSDKDLMFGRDLTLSYTSGIEVPVLESERVFKTLKQKGGFYLLYLLLTPVNLYTTDGDGRQTSSTPIGLGLGPGLAGYNMIVAGSANKKFEQELLEYDLNGTLIKKGETKYGLLGIDSDSFESLKLKIN